MFLTQVQAPERPVTAAGWEAWRWGRTRAVTLVDNLGRLEESLVILEEGETGVRRDKILLEAVGGVLTDLIRESVSAQWAWETNLAGDDREREVVRRQGLHHLAVERGWEMCVHCGDMVGQHEWSLGRLCGHQLHTVGSV